MRKAVLTALLGFAMILSIPQAWAFAPQKASFDRVAARAEEARGANRVEEAIGLYRKAVSLRPRWAEGWWYLATLLYERDAYADAVVAFDRVVALAPNNAAAWAMLGLCEFRLDRFDDALEHIQRARQLGIGAEPQLKNVTLYHHGLLLLGKGDFEQAQETLGVLSADGVEDDNLLAALGLSVLRMRFSALLNGDSALRETVRRAGQAESLAARKMFDDAQREYERLATDFPKTPNTQFALGRFLLENNQVEASVDAFERELENSPNHPIARLAIVDAKLRLRDFEGGLPFAEEALKLAPNSPLAHYFLGVILVELKQTERAIAALETARKSLPNEPKVYFVLGRAYAQANRPQDAERARATFARLSKEQEGGGAQPSQPAQTPPATKAKPNRSKRGARSTARLPRRPDEGLAHAVAQSSVPHAHMLPFSRRPFRPSTLSLMTPKPSAGV